MQLVTVEEGVEGELVDIDDLLRTGSDVELVIPGPNTGNSRQEYVKKRVLSYTQNYYWNDAAVITAEQEQDETEKYIHLVIPIPDNLNGVSKVALKSTVNTKVHLKVANLFLSKDGPNPICAGEQNPSASAWIEDFDDGNNVGPTAERMCRRRYGKLAWLGDDNELTAEFPNANCCGDDGAEYYSGESKAHLNNEGAEANTGCFNGQPIEHGKS